MADRPSPPFLTIFTRHLPSREEEFARCVKSIRNQPCHDYQHLVVEDVTPYDVHEADKLFHIHRDEVVGRYVHMLDDDDYLIDNDFIGTVRQIAEDDDPDVVIVKMHRAMPQFDDVLPPSHLWGKRPEPGKIGAPCFVVRASVWKKRCKLFGWPTKGHGDHCLIAALWDEGYRFHWLDRIVVRVDRIGHEKLRGK